MIEKLYNLTDLGARKPKGQNTGAKFG